MQHMEIEKEYNKCNLMLGGDNKWKKMKRKKTMQDYKKTHMTLKL